MPRGDFPLYSFNAGLVSKLALGRLDVSKLRLAAETMTNWLPYVIGPMQLRPGTQYIANTNGNSQTKPIPFIFSHDTTAIIEVGNSVMQVRIADSLVTRNSVSTTVTSGDFSASTGWTLTNTGGATTSISGGKLKLSAVPSGSRSTCKQTLSIAGGDQNTEHGLNIVVTRGPVYFRMGTSDGAHDLIATTALGTGTHSLAFTPTGASAYLEFFSANRYSVYVDSCTIESSGTMTIATPWDVTTDVLDWTQSGDIIYISCYGYQQRKIERRATHSWSLVLYEPTDGPFQTSASDDILITPNKNVGDIQLTADAVFFSTDMAGSLFWSFNAGQNISQSVGAENTFTNTVRVTGVGAQRSIAYASSGTWSGTVRLQRSVDSSGAGFTDVSAHTSTFSVSSYKDGLDNTIAWYRLGFKSGEYTSGTADLNLNFAGGGDAGIIRLTTISSSTLAKGSVLAPLSSTAASRDWLEGKWSGKYGYPSAVQLYEGRLWWFGEDNIDASGADSYETFSISSTGDASPIDRTVGYGPVEVINWAMPLQQLILGLADREASIKSSDYGTPITPTNFSVKDISTQGSAQVKPIQIDGRGIFVQQAKRRVYQIFYDLAANSYTTSDLTNLLPDLDSNFIAIAVQRQPDTRVHCVRADGSVLVLVYAPDEKVASWYTHTPGGTGAVEDVCVLPGDVEDSVYYYVKHTINSATVRFVEKHALRTACVGGSLNQQLDAFTSISQSSDTTISGLSKYEGDTVGVWANGKDLGTYTVSGGSITVSEAVTTAIVGYVYTATFKSTKLGYAHASGTALIQPKRVDHIGFVLHNTHAQGLKVGKDSSNLYSLPLIVEGAAVSTGDIHSDVEIEMTPFLGSYDTDSRIYMQATAPKPCTVVAAAISMETNDRT